MTTQDNAIRTLVLAASAILARLDLEAEERDQRGDSLIFMGNACRPDLRRAIEVGRAALPYQGGPAEHGGTGWTPAMRYIIKCDDCKRTMRGTDSMAESARGGRCEACKATA